VKHRWVFADYDYRCMNCHLRMLRGPTPADADGCDPGWIPVGTRIVRTLRDSAHWPMDATENLNRHGEIIGYDLNPGADFYRIMFDGDDEPTRYAIGHRGIVELSVIDLLGELGRVVRAGEALKRGLRDGLRLQNGAVSADALCAELADDPP